ncbi:MAG: ATP-binding protein [Schleiferiaceae bacterium]|nr:ATP-binding protein [Schleiferiaceae bacterium]MDR9442945.1 ATP-binding protein [Schleiferiaceae bacterium]
MISRYPMSYARERLFEGKALVIYGARQVGKTTFVRHLLQEVGLSYQAFNADNADVRSLLGAPNVEMLRQLVGDRKIIFIDEVQRIENSGLLLKLLVDEMPEVQVIATGSSSFQLAGAVNEPLTGRKYEQLLFPLSFLELLRHTDLLTERRLLPSRLVYGCYPEIVTRPERASELLQTLSQSYLYKDLLSLEGMKKPRLLEKIVKALALQIGSEVSFNELGRLVGADSKTVEKYIQLLEEAFVIFSLEGFSRNVRTEIRKRKKIYFYDNGIRNAVIGNLNPLAKRDDQGKLWENYLMSERRKMLKLSHQVAKAYFWRTTQQQEVDYVEEVAGNLKAVEFKWNPQKRASISKTFIRAYPEAKPQIVHPENYHSFLQEV